MNGDAPTQTSCIAFARHGETAWTGHRYAGRADVPLTDEGRANARGLAVRVARSGLLADSASVIVASPLSRARETAMAVAAAVERPVVVDPRWVEVGFGSLEGLTFDEASLAWPAVTARLAAGDVAIDWPGGETQADLHARGAAALDEVLARDVPVLVVAHGIVIRVALAMLMTASDPLPRLPAAGLVVARRLGGGWALETPGIQTPGNRDEVHA